MAAGQTDEGLEMSIREIGRQRRLRRREVQFAGFYEPLEDAKGGGFLAAVPILVRFVDYLVRPAGNFVDQAEAVGMREVARIPADHLHQVFARHRLA